MSPADSSVKAALTALLGETGLEARAQEGGGYIIVSKPAPSSPPADGKDANASDVTQTTMERRLSEPVSVVVVTANKREQDTLDVPLAVATAHE